MLIMSREQVMLHCFILFSIDYGRNIGHVRSNWRYDYIGYEYISKFAYNESWFYDKVNDNFNRSEWKAIKRVFK